MRHAGCGCCNQLGARCKGMTGVVRLTNTQDDFSLLVGRCSGGIVGVGVIAQDDCVRDAAALTNIGVATHDDIPKTRSL